MRSASSPASRRPSVAADPGSAAASRSRTCDVSCSTCPVSIHRAIAESANESVRSSPQTVLYARPIFVSDALMFSIPTRPGHWPLQLATVRIGPRWRRSPGRTWWLYCQTASATTSGASRSMPAKTSMPIRWLEMKPCPRDESTGCARRTVTPCRPNAASTLRSSSSWAGQPSRFAVSRRSPEATSTTWRVTSSLPFRARAPLLSVHLVTRRPSGLTRQRVPDRASRACRGRRGRTRRTRPPPRRAASRAPRP